MLANIYIYPGASEQNRSTITTQQAQEQQKISPFYSRWFNAVYTSVITPIQSGLQSLFNTVQYTLFPSMGKKEPVSAPAQKTLPATSGQGVTIAERINSFSVPQQKNLTPINKSFTQPTPKSTPITPSTTPQNPEPEPAQIQTIPTPPQPPKIEKSQLQRIAQLATIKAQKVTQLFSNFTWSAQAQELNDLLSFIEQQMDTIHSTQMKLSAINIVNTTAHIRTLLNTAEQELKENQYKETEKTGLQKKFTELSNLFFNNHRHSLTEITKRLTEISTELRDHLQNPYNLLGEEVCKIFEQFDSYIESTNALFTLIAEENLTDIGTYVAQAFSQLNNLIALFPIAFKIPEKNNGNK